MNVYFCDVHLFLFNVLLEAEEYEGMSHSSTWDKVGVNRL